MYIRSFVVGYLLLLSYSLYAQNYNFNKFNPVIDSKDIEDHIKFLASDELEGRFTGSEGEKLAIQYISDFFKFLNLSSFLESSIYLHEFEFNLGVEIKDNSEFSIYNNKTGELSTLVLEKDWIPVGFSASGVFNDNKVMFAGYGIKAPAFGDYPEYNSYKDLDVKDKWVMVFRYWPENISMDYKIHLSKYSDLKRKASLARDLGAKGIIFVNGPNSAVNTLVPLSTESIPFSVSILVISISDEYAQKLLGEVENLKYLQDKLDNGEHIDGFDLDNTISGKVFLENKIQKSANVVGRLNFNNDDQNFIIVGAHVDHLGAKILDDGSKQIYYGADDNASGVACVLELAHFLSYMYTNKNLNAQKDIVFAIWSGEELGLLGSSSFVKTLQTTFNNQSLYPFISSMFNVDMVGRFKGDLILEGVGSSSKWQDYINLFKDSFDGQLVLKEDPYLPTDSTSFYLAKVPVISFFTGTHKDYHKPSDTWDKINFEGIANITKFISDMLISLSNTQDLLDYIEVPNPSGGGGHSTRVLLGIIPDYSNNNIKGVMLAGVRPQGPADNAGLKKGDIIVMLAGQKIENIYDYQFILGLLKPNVEVDIQVLRNSEILNLKIIPEAKD